MLNQSIACDYGSMDFTGPETSRNDTNRTAEFTTELSGSQTTPQSSSSSLSNFCPGELRNVLLPFSSFESLTLSHQDHSLCDFIPSNAL